MSQDSQPEQAKKKRKWYKRADVILVVSFITILVLILEPNFRRARGGGHLTNCKSNLKNIGSAFEMYSTDWSGKYPETMELLIPNYLKTIPECQGAGDVTYTMKTGLNVAYNTPGYEDYYFLQCEGSNHTVVSVPKNYPQYDGIQGLIER
jgi:competence protein ComGC